MSVMRYVLAVAGVVIVAIIAILLLFRNPAPNNGQKPGGKPVVKTSDFADTASRVVWTMQGPLVGEDQRRAIRITVTQSERRLEILDGYEETTERTETFSNTDAAYKTFLQALENAGFSKERSVATKDERGVCPLGNRFIYEINNNGDQKLKSWSASCSNSVGPFAGNGPLIRQIFQKQIPDYNKQIQNVHIF